MGRRRVPKSSMEKRFNRVDGPFKDGAFLMKRFLMAVAAISMMALAGPTFAVGKNVPVGAGCGGGGCKSAHGGNVLLHNVLAGAGCGGGGCKSAHGGNILLNNVLIGAGCGGGGCKSAHGGNVLLAGL
jgi:hypothetical protein